ncbi:MAG TPA: hypothetical protein VMH39_10280 [Gemmatimonadaceae bacterium]|nr:hypothetical protein [Gemmatimonadaceae bacterium]
MVRRGRLWLGVSALVVRGLAPLGAQQQASANADAFTHGVNLETAGKYRESVPFFRAALHGINSVSALLELEQVYSVLGTPDSLLGVLDTLIAAKPREAVFRSAQLRTLQTLGREKDLRYAFEQWVRAAPGDAAPYRDYARILMDRNEGAAADSVIRQGGRALGSTRDLEAEVAEVHAAMGEWVASADAWREALAQQPDYSDAAAYALAPTPPTQRAAIEQVFLAPPLSLAARRTAAALDESWGAFTDGWLAIRELPPDTASADIWSDYADHAEANDEWATARDALVQVLQVRPSRALALRAATAALNSGDAALVLKLIPLSGAESDSATLARDYVPLWTRALAESGHPDDAERIVHMFDRWCTPGLYNMLTRTVALGWVRRGDLARARADLAASGPGSDSSDTGGWLALYAGDLKTARALLRGGSETTPELALALGTIARVPSDTAPTLAAAFLALATGDSEAAATRFAEAGEGMPQVASLMFETAAQIHAARHEDAGAIALWRRIVEQDSAAPEAPLADLEWARALMRRGDAAGAAARFEHLILTYPASAIVPQARREYDIARRMIPPARTA